MATVSKGKRGGEGRERELRHASCVMGKNLSVFNGAFRRNGGEGGVEGGNEKTKRTKVRKIFKK